MKRNFCYLIILISLCCLTYYFEEFRVLRKIEQQRLKDQLVHPDQFDELVAMRTTNASLLFSKEEILTEKDKKRVDKKKAREFFLQLTHLRIRRIIEKATLEKLGIQHFFDDFSQRIYLQFKDGHTKLILGKKLEFDRAFYMKVTQNKEEKYVIVYDTSPRTGLYLQEEEHRTNFAYLNLKAMIKREDRFFTISSLKPE